MLKGELTVAQLAARRGPSRPDPGMKAANVFDGKQERQKSDDALISRLYQQIAS